MDGFVSLVGAGPGDPGLLTLRGAELLAQADLVLYDGLVNPLLLRLARGRCERTSRVRDDRGPHVEQAEVNSRLIDAARSGLRVVRLKGGDPFLFGRGSEEAAALAAAGIPFEVVPGVTAAIAAGEYAGISLTHRDFASAVAFVTGHEDPRKASPRLDYTALARFPGTLVFYMGLHRLRAITESLIEAGLAEATPAAVICRASQPGQQTVVAPLKEIADATAAAGLKPPSLIIIGECIVQRERIAWFEQRPLFGLRIGITRPDDASLQTLDVPAAGGRSGIEATIARCLELGAEPVLMPAIKLEPLLHTDALDAEIKRLTTFDWIVFTSANGVRALLQRLWQVGHDARWLGTARLACIGPATAQALQEWNLRADLVPDEFRAEALAEKLIPLVAGRRVLWARASRGRDVIPSQLRAAGALVEEVVVYQHCDATAFPPDVAAWIERGEIDWIGLSSPAIARSVARMYSTLTSASAGVQFAAISPLTAEAARAEGLPVTAVAESFTWDGIFEAIARNAETHASQAAP